MKKSHFFGRQETLHFSLFLWFMAMFSEPYCSVVNVGGGGRGEGGGEVEAWVYKKQVNIFFTCAEIISSASCTFLIKILIRLPAKISYFETAKNL